MKINKLSIFPSIRFIFKENQRESIQTLSNSSLFDDRCKLVESFVGKQVKVVGRTILAKAEPSINASTNHVLEPGTEGYIQTIHPPDKDGTPWVLLRYNSPKSGKSVQNYVKANELNLTETVSQDESSDQRYYYTRYPKRNFFKKMLDSMLGHRPEGEIIEVSQTYNRTNSELYDLSEESQLGGTTSINFDTDNSPYYDAIQQEDGSQSPAYGIFLNGRISTPLQTTKLDRDMCSKRPIQQTPLVTKTQAITIAPTSVNSKKQKRRESIKKRRESIIKKIETVNLKIAKLENRKALELAKNTVDFTKLSNYSNDISSYKIIIADLIDSLQNTNKN